MLSTAWELACLLQFSDPLQLLPDKETIGSWRTPTRENPKSLNAFWFSFGTDVLTWLDVLGILLLKHQTSSLIQLKHWWDGFLLWLWLRLLFIRPVLKVSMWRRQIEAHPMQCFQPRESLLAYSSSVTPYSCCLTRKLSGAEGHLRGRTPRAWMPFDSASEQMSWLGWMCWAFSCWSIRQAA